MSVSQRKFLLLTGGLLVMVLLAVVVWNSRPHAMLQRRQVALLEGIEKASPGRIQRLVAESYADRWGFDREDLVTTIIDGGSQFLVLEIGVVDPVLEIGNGRATFKAKLSIEGKPVGPAGIEVTRRINQLKEPFTFVWEKQSFLPSGWRLVEVRQPDLPDDLYGYRPGDIGRAIRGE